MNEEIKEQIANSRSVYPDRSLVVYDLTTGVDFTKPRVTAEALAEVFFNMDVSKWFKEENGSLTFNAKDSVEIRIADEHNKRIEKTINDFKKDLDKDELRRAYSSEIEAAANYHAGLGMIMFGGLMTAMIAQSMVRKGQSNQYVRDLMDKILGNVKVSTF
jgi:hypothetical protein